MKILNIPLIVSLNSQASVMKFCVSLHLYFRLVVSLPVTSCWMLYFVVNMPCGYDSIQHQRTNGPFNAHLRSAAYTNKHV